MAKYKISYIIDGLHDVLPNKNDVLEIASVTFEYRENERVGTVYLEIDDQSQEK